MKSQLDKLSLAELNDLEAALEIERQKREKTRFADALAALHATAKQHGFTLAELTAKMPGAAPKYANPEDKTQTWSGRGRKPLWFQAHLDAGKSPEDMEV